MIVAKRCTAILGVMLGFLLLPSVTLYGSQIILSGTADCLLAESAHVLDVCSDMVTTNSLSSGHIEGDLIRSNTLQTMALSAQYAQVQLLSADAIVTNTLYATNVVGSTNLRAFVSNHTPRSYTFGTYLFFDTIDDDPHHNISQGSYTSYTAPIDGYYLIAANVSFNGIASSLINTSIAIFDIVVNGTTKYSVRNSSIFFESVRESAATSLMILKAGDVVTLSLRLHFIYPFFGEINFSGNTIVSTSGRTTLSIHFLSGFAALPGGIPPTLPVLDAPTPVVWQPCDPYICPGQCP